MNYLDRVAETCIAANKKAMNQPSGWDNKKIKNMRQYLPRGKAYKKLRQKEWQAQYEAGKVILSEANRFILENFEKTQKA